MTSLLDRKSPGEAQRGEPEAGFRLPGIRRSRRPLFAIASAVLVFASIALFAGIYSSANHQTPVLVTVHTIEKGQPIVGADLAQAGVAVSGGVLPIPVSGASLLAGKRAAVTIPAGSLLTSGDITGSPQIAAGDAVVGLALKDGQFPSSGLQSGDQVMIVQTASPGTPLTTTASGGGSTGSPAGATGVLVPQAGVFDVSAPSSSAGGGVTLLVSVEVSTTLAAAVSTAATADQASLVLLPQGAGGSSVGQVSGAQGGGTR